MGFVIKWPSRMQEQWFFSFLGGAGSYFRTGLKNPGRGQKFRGRAAPPEFGIPISSWGGSNNCSHDSDLIYLGR